jgi:hypothetical protein
MDMNPVVQRPTLRKDQQKQFEVQRQLRMSGNFEYFDYIFSLGVHRVPNSLKESFLS